MIAMLVDAIRSFQTELEARQSARREEFSEARSWVFSDDDNGFFSFRAVCDALELDPRTLRTGLARWEKRKLAGEQALPIVRRSIPGAKRISG
jgi:hypothetical protein